MFLFLFGNMILVELCPDFLLKQKIFLFGDKLSSVFQHGFLRSADKLSPVCNMVSSGLQNSRPEEDTLENWQKLVSKQKYFLF